MEEQHKYLHIVNWTIEQIENGTFLPGSRFFSEYQLTERFSCSRQTVRRALEVLEQQGRITRVQGSGTFIAGERQNNNTPEDKSMTVGLVFTYMDSYIFPSIVRGIGDVLLDHGYLIQLAWTDNSIAKESAALRLMMDTQLDGLIIEPTRSALPSANIDLYNLLAEQETPVVFIDSCYPELPFPYVALDDTEAGWLATNYLIERGHRKIACILPHTHRQGQLRYLGHVKALREQALAICEEDILWYSKENMDQILGEEHLCKNLAPYSAVLCYNDTVALQVIETLNKFGIRVPQEISVIGIDNSEASRYASLTSIAHPAVDLGEAAAKMLVSMIGGAKGKTKLFPPRLVERTTVADLRRGGDNPTE
ncbi:MAG TPA: GntR family transcriptional regulator [Sphaerochaeta sp.]|nr:GntR family transcriptional regulator [Sphaerochaeta sp.]